jgi:rubrerythrin
MMLSSKESIATLTFALTREIESRDYYRSCLDIATIPGTRVVLEQLVSDEQRHYAIVSRLIEEANGNDTPGAVDTVETGDTRTLLESQFGHTILDRVPDADITVRDMLSRARDNEKESHDTYANAAESIKDAEVKAIFQHLANEEKQHYILVDNLMTYLSDPGNWTYEEENLLFRRG